MFIELGGVEELDHNGLVAFAYQQSDHKKSNAQQVCTDVDQGEHSKIGPVVAIQVSAQIGEKRGNAVKIYIPIKVLAQWLVDATPEANLKKSSAATPALDFSDLDGVSS